MRLHTFLEYVYIPSRLEISPGATAQIAVALRQLDRWAGHSLSIEDFSEDLVRRFLADFCRTHAPATTNDRRRDLLAVWQCAFDEDFLDRPPCRKRIPRCNGGALVPDAWTPAEVGRILATTKQERRWIATIPAADWWLSFLLVLYDTGERCGAALATVPSDLSLDGASIIFRKTKTRQPRVCPLHPDTIEACIRIYDLHRARVWPWPYTRNWLDTRFKRILKRAGVRHPSGKLFRLFRSTSGSLVEAAGGDGARHLGNSRRVFEKHYKDPRICGEGQLKFLPRPKF